MEYDPAIHHRRSIRLRGYDYARPGAYFVTLCTHHKEHLFGEMVEGGMHLNRFGEIVEMCWKWLAKRYTYIGRDEWTVMPNHFHGIISITNRRGGSRTAPTKPLGRLVGTFKTMSTGRINQIRGTPAAPVWQRNYFEHIIRNGDEWDKIREYVSTNPARWLSDPGNPEFVIS